MIFVWIYNQQFQGTILVLMVFDLQGYHVHIILTLLIPNSYGIHCRSLYCQPQWKDSMAQEREALRNRSFHASWIRVSIYFLKLAIRLSNCCMLNRQAEIIACGLLSIGNVASQKSKSNSRSVAELIGSWVMWFRHDPHQIPKE